MIREHQSNLRKSHSRFSRVLSFLLLGFIFYGTTVEAAHTHGGVPSRIVSSSSFSDPATDAKGATPLVGCGDCLICQLHQNFSATLIALPPTVGPTSLSSQFVLLTTTPPHTQTSAPRSGRAPPQSNQ